MPVPREWWPRLTEFVARRKADSSTLLIGFVRHTSHIGPTSERANAFVAAGGTRMLLQFSDPNTDLQNRERVGAWSAAWAARGVEVEGWWRVEHSTADRHPDVPGISAWWPNAEQPPEVARLPAIYAKGGCVGLVALGKMPAGSPPAGGLCAIECFRESAASDTNVRNSVEYWRDVRGVPVSRLVVMLQGYGTLFQPVPLEAAEGIALGVSQFALYPIDGFPLEDITAVGALIA
jgi:hypothetical protein